MRDGTGREGKDRGQAPYDPYLEDGMETVCRMQVCNIDSFIACYNDSNADKTWKEERMNGNRRKALADVADMLEEAKSKLEDILGEEEEYQDNMPENMQYGERWEKADEACDNMGEAIDELENAIASIGDATE